MKMETINNTKRNIDVLGEVFPSCITESKDEKGVLQKAFKAGGHFDPQKTGKHLGPKGKGHKGDLPVLKVDKKGNDLFLCKFNFSTNYKGILEVNRISIRLYKKNEEKNINESFMMIKHISKPISIVLD